MIAPSLRTTISVSADGDKLFEDGLLNDVDPLLKRLCGVAPFGADNAARLFRKTSEALRGTDKAIPVRGRASTRRSHLGSTLDRDETAWLR